MKGFTLCCLMLSLTCSLFFFSDVFADESKCSFKNLPVDMEIAGCHKENGVDILELVPVNVSSTVADFDLLPTYVVRGKDKEAILSRLGVGSARPYNHLIALPDPESIVEVFDAPPSAKSKLTQRNWNILDMKVVVYKGARDDDGYTLVCSTLERDAGGEIMLVSQCNDFYEGDIKKLKEVLLSTDALFNIPQTLFPLRTEQ